MDPLSLSPGFHELRTPLLSFGNISAHAGDCVFLGMLFLALMQREIARRKVGELVKHEVLTESDASERSEINDPRDTA